MDVEIINDKENKRFVTKVEGHEAYLSYKISDDKINFYLTFTPLALRGKGLAKKIVEFAFKYAGENNLKVIPTCSYVQSFLEKNNEYKSLLA